jgi:DNA polymerase I
MDYNPLVFGKQQVDNVVSVEAGDGSVELFIQQPNGSVVSRVETNHHWVLSNKRHSKDWIKLKGDLHYQYGKKIKSKEEFFATKNYLRGEDLYTIYDSNEATLVNKGYTYYKGLKPTQVTILAFDIETTGLNHDQTSKVLLISNTLRKDGVVSRRLFKFSDYENDGQMIAHWCEWVREIDPSILCGHNIVMYDLPYMRYVAETYGYELNLGRDGSKIKVESYESRFRKDATQFYHYNKHRIYGREIVDTLFLSVKYDIATKKYESYGLKSIIAAEGLEVKNRQFYDASQIRFKYKDPVEWSKICAYSENDADDAISLFDLMAPPFFYMTQSIPKTFQGVTESATGSQLNALMVRAYLQEGHSIPKADEAAGYEGAISFGNPGIYKNVFKVDVASLYPSIMLTYEVYDKAKDPDGKFLKLVKYFTEERLKNKKLAKTDKYYDDLQNAQKILINSFYGFLGANGLNFNSPKNAAKVTMHGRMILQDAIKWSKENGFKIVNADTDSISFSFENEREMSQELCVKLLNDINSLYPSTIRFEDDGLYETVIVFKAKNYILYKDGKIKSKGSALKSSTKEPALKEFINELVKEMISPNNNYVEVYDRYIAEAMDIKDIKRWASKKTITDKVLNPQRTNEQKVLDALGDSEFSEGDKIYIYFKEDDSLGLVQNFDGKYNKDKMIEKVFKTSKLFDSVIPEGTFINYKLKKNKNLLDKLLTNGV